MTIVEPQPPFPEWPRYSDIPFPPYRFVPGLNPHPHTSPLGHSFGRPAGRLPPWRPEEWRALTPYLYGVDLYNYAYWWECHETLEGLWHAAGRTGAAASFLQAIIHVAAAQLSRHGGKREGSKRQAEKGLARFASALERGPVYMGLEIPGFSSAVRDSFLSEVPTQPAMIRLLL
jgi:hypothetical protein